MKKFLQVMVVMTGVFCILFSSKVYADSKELDEEINKFVEYISQSDKEYRDWNTNDAVQECYLYRPKEEDEALVLYYLYNSNGEYNGYIVIECLEKKIMEYTKAPSPLELFKEKNTEEVSYIKKYIYTESLRWAAEKTDTIMYLGRNGEIVEEMAVSLRTSADLELTPHLQNGSLCIPTAISHLILYWDDNGYPNLMNNSYTFAMLQQAITEIMENEYSGSTYNASIIPTIQHYAYNNGFYEAVAFSAVPAFSTVISEIDAGRPVLVGFVAGSYYSSSVGHMTCCIGYNTYNEGRYITLADGWHDYRFSIAWSSYNDTVFGAEFN